MAKTLQRMERDALISREPDPSDRRLARVRLTPHARALRGDLIDAATEVNAAATKGLTDREIREFMRTLSRISDILETARPARDTTTRAARRPGQHRAEEQ